KPDVVSTPEPLLTKFAQQRTIDILRTEPKLAQRIHDISEAELFLSSVVNEVLGYGPLETLLQNESISEIIAVGPHCVSVERNGQREDIACSFADDQHMLRIVANMLRRIGCRLRPKWPIVDLRLPDGSLVNVVMP